MSFFNDCNPVDCALEALDSMGLNIAEVGLIKRVWPEDKIGRGTPVDTLELFTPTPRIEQIRQSHNNKQAGQERRGDVFVKFLSKNKYPEVSSIDATSTVKNEEIYYYVDGELFEVVEVTENLTHWNVLISRAKKRRLYLDTSN